MSGVMRSQTVSVSIEAAPSDVYAFAANPENLPRWAPAFCHSVENRDGSWIAHTPDGPVGFEFVGYNELGVLDHVVTVQSGTKARNFVRVISNGSGSEILFTLFQAAGATEEQFAEDAELVRKDLETLKGILENPRR